MKGNTWILLNHLDTHLYKSKHLIVLLFVLYAPTQTLCFKHNKMNNNVNKNKIDGKILVQTILELC